MAASREGHYRGVRERPCGRYATEIRDQWKKTRVWLGTFDTPDGAARSLRGTKVKTNFTHSSSGAAFSTILIGFCFLFQLQQLKQQQQQQGATIWGQPKVAHQVYPSSLVVFERDYLSLDKRYPRLFISPECSKVTLTGLGIILGFPSILLSEDAGAEQKERPAMTSTEPVKLECATTVWNAKMILMSGLSQNSLEELSSERSYDDRVPHLCNMLRFAVLKKDQYIMAIGGPWDTVDGGDPSVDDSSLVQTVLRYAKDVTQLDLRNCRHWNRFLEACFISGRCKLIVLEPLQIHYDRVGKDGLFSHKEVTVLYVPDLSDCLPSIETWREQWLAHKKAVAERRRLLEFKKEVYCFYKLQTTILACFTFTQQRRQPSVGFLSPVAWPGTMISYCSVYQHP
ncbi:hypothetical protein RHGRI_011590 [Rhododendron griersonianum]|uniref:AP2/ERF domain-containing protein n=1 Tax=Rhododendron griersonianum TaxID=479676 RepID=A0AAV6KNA4_9ERIC|nr:hypothetical protein RHGRI_011590 [Rhododendron griersonianum]